MKLSPTTFGSFPAAITLTEILNKQGDDKVTRKVCSVLNDFVNTLYVIATIEDKGTKKKLAHLWKREGVSIVENRKFPDEVQRFTLNVMSTSFKLFAKGQF